MTNTERNKQILERKTRLVAEGKCRDCGNIRNRLASYCDECLDKKLASQLKDRRIEAERRLLASGIYEVFEIKDNKIHLLAITKDKESAINKAAKQQRSCFITRINDDFLIFNK